MALRPYSLVIRISLTCFKIDGPFIDWFCTVPRIRDDWIAAALWTCRSSSACGCVLLVFPIVEEFKDVDAIGMSDTWREWVVVGRFGLSGPFTLTEVKSRRVSEPCSFRMQDKAIRMINSMGMN